MDARRVRATRRGRASRAGQCPDRQSLADLVTRTPTAARMNEEAGRIELLEVSCLMMLIRTVVSTDLPGHSSLTHEVRELADALTDLATGLGDLHGRQRAVDRAFCRRCRAAVAGGPAARLRPWLPACASSASTSWCSQVSPLRMPRPRSSKVLVSRGRPRRRGTSTSSVCPGVYWTSTGTNADKRRAGHEAPSRSPSRRRPCPDHSLPPAATRTCSGLSRALGAGCATVLLGAGPQPSV